MSSVKPCLHKENNSSLVGYYICYDINEWEVSCVKPCLHKENISSLLDITFVMILMSSE